MNPLKTLGSAAAMAGSLLLFGCDRAPQAPPTPPAPPPAATDFTAVEAKLDRGGDLFLYLATGDLVAGLPKEIDSWRDAVLAAAGDDLPLPREQVIAYSDILRDALQDSGLLELRAYGLSSIQLEPGLSRSRSVAYSGPVATRGLLWQLGGSAAPHPIAALDFLPATTAYAGFADFDPEVLWTFVQRFLDRIPDPQVRAQAKSAPDLAAAVAGITIPDLLKSLGTEWGFVITADPATTLSVPTSPKAIEIPRPDAALLVAVTNDYLYDVLVDRARTLLGASMPVKTADADGVRMVTVSVPDLGFPLTPTIARFGRYVALATSPELITQLARAGANPPALLRDDAGFRRLADREKLEGNAFVYLSERGADILRRVQLASMESEEEIPPALRTKIGGLYDALSERFVLSIGRLESDAYTTVTYSAHGARQIVAALAVAPAAILSSLAVPAMKNALEQAQATTCLNELRELKLLLDRAATEANAAPGELIPHGQLATMAPPGSDLARRLAESPFRDSLGNVYGDFRAGTPPQVAPATAARFPRLTREGFWGEFSSP